LTGKSLSVYNGAMTDNSDGTWPITSNIIASIYEGEEWLSRLEKEKLLMTQDLSNLDGTMSGVSAAAIKYAIEKTDEAIVQIRLEMMLLNE
jgi:hypothetical protein